MNDVLGFLQGRRLSRELFDKLLYEVVSELESVPARERDRWLELLSYIQALVYHDRQPGEWPGLSESLERSVSSDERRREVHDMGQTIAEMLRAEGRQEGEAKGEAKGVTTGKTESILNLLRRFPTRTVPKDLVTAIRRTKDHALLDNWVVTAADVKSV